MDVKPQLIPKLKALRLSGRRGYVLFTPAARMLAHLNGGRADGGFDRRLASYLRPDLLVLDDFGLLPLRSHEGEESTAGDGSLRHAHSTGGG